MLTQTVLYSVQLSLSFRLESVEQVVSSQASDTPASPAIFSSARLPDIPPFDIGLVKLAASLSQSQETCRDSVDSLALRMVRCSEYFVGPRTEAAEGKCTKGSRRARTAPYSW